MSFGFGFGFPRRAAAGGAAPSLNFDFTSLTSLPSRITFSRTSNATLTDSNGRVAYAPHNLLTNSEDFEATAWVKSPSGVGLAPVVTANAAVAPDGTTTADLVVLNKNGGTTGSDWSWLYQNTTPAANTTYIFSVWVKAATVGDIGKVVLLSSVLTQLVTLTADWQRVTTTGTTASTGTISQGIRVRGGEGTADTASFYVWGAQLNVANAPVNLLTFSEQFDNSAWAKQNATIIINQVIAPDGTLTGDKLVMGNGIGPSTAANDGILQSSVVASGVYTYSVFAKAGEFTGLRIRENAVVGSFLEFDLLTGVAPAGSAQFVNPTMISVGNGWYRCSWTSPTGMVNATKYGLRVSGTGDGTSGIFIWGAQLNTGSTALPYVATTSSIYLPPSYNSTTPKNLLGFTQEFDNAAWTKSNSFVQTNLLTWSEQFDNAAWSKSSTTVTANSTTAPDGTATADSLFEVASTTFHLAFVSLFSFAAGAYTFSVYLKQNGRNFVSLGGGNAPWNPSVVFDLNAGTVVSQTGGTGTITSVGNGWYRCTVTATATAGGSNVQIVLQSDATTTNYLGDVTKGAFLWGAQLVQGSVPGDYQVTTSAAAAVQYSDPNGTRTADKLVENTTLNFHFAAPASPIATISGTPSTLSVYMKAGERRYGGIHHQDGTAKGCSVDLLTGTLGTPYGGATAQLFSLGSGWYRLSVTATLVAANTPAIYVSDSNSLASYTGDGTSGIYIWGAQLSNSASVDPYVYNPQAAPTSTAYYGPRFDYNPTGTPVLGSELVTNGDFSAGSTGWTTSGTLSFTGGACVFAGVNTATIWQTAWTLSPGVLYSAQVTVTAGSGTLLVYFGSSGSNSIIVSAGNTYTVRGYSSGDNIFYVQSSVAMTIDNVSAKAVTGYTATANGLLIEQQSTNLQTYSEQFNALGWGIGASTVVTTNVAVAPNGTTTANKIAETTTTASFSVTANPTMSLNTTYTLSLYGKAAERSWLILNIFNGTASTWTWYNISNGTLGTIGSGATASIQDVGNGWYRCLLTVTTAASGTPNIAFWCSNANNSITYAGTAGNGILAWGAQLELGAFSTSYIPTVASQVTRAADNASMLGDNFATWYNATEGTLYADWEQGSGTNAGGSLFSINDGTAATNRILLASDGSSSASIIPGFFVTAAGVAQASINAATISPNTRNKIAGAYKANDFAVSLNGATALTDNSGTVPVVTQANIGTNGVGAAQSSGTIRSISYYPTALPSTTLQAITA